MTVKAKILIVKTALLLVLGAMLFTTSVFDAQAKEASVMKLRQNIQIEGRTVTLGDVFHGVGDAADVFVAEAPKPGHFMTLPLLEVLPILRQYGIKWERPDGVSRIRVERKSQLLNPADLELILSDAIQRDNGANKFNITLYGNFQNIRLPINEDMAHVSVNMVSLDHRTGRFTTTLNIPMGEGEFRSVKITGRIEELVSVPVLAAQASREDVISNSDIVWRDMPKQRLGQNIILNSEQIIGKAARRSLRPETPLRLTDVQEPVLIRKGTLVSMVITAGPMKLSTIGRALENGGKNDIIQIVNVDSHKTIEGLVVGKDNVEILYYGNITGTGQ